MKSQPDVLVVGAGPTGLTAAAEALRHGLSVRIIDQNEAATPYSKALVVHSRTLEVFHDMGLAAQIVAAGKEFRALNIYAEQDPIARIVFSELDWEGAPYPFWLSLPQCETEACLESHLVRLGGTVERRTQLLDLREQEDGVVATLRTPQGESVPCKASWVVGCDGARSSVRHLLEIPYEGEVEDEVFILGDVKLDWDIPEDEGQNFLASDGILLVVPMPEPKRWRIIAHLPKVQASTKVEITQDLLQSILRRRTGKEVRLFDMGFTSQFSVKHFVAARYQKGRGFLAGDAAHAHSPVGGQGLNTGVQDAFNLMFKLALVQKGQATALLLSSYGEERHALAIDTVRNIQRATTLVTLQNPISQLVRNQLARVLMNTDLLRNRMGPNVGMLHVGYRNSSVVAEQLPERTLGQRIVQYLGEQTSFSAGPAAGERVPMSPRMLDVVSGGRHTLLIFCGSGIQGIPPHLCKLAEQVATRYLAPIHPVLVSTTEDPVNGLEVLPDPGGELHRRHGATTECLYLIRPDHHIAYRSHNVDLEGLFAYLDRLFVPRSW